MEKLKFKIQKSVFLLSPTSGDVPNPFFNKKLLPQALESPPPIYGLFQNIFLNTSLTMTQINSFTAQLTDLLQFLQAAYRKNYPQNHF